MSDTESLVLDGDNGILMSAILSLKFQSEELSHEYGTEDNQHAELLIVKVKQ